MSAVACLQKNAMFVVPKASCVQVVRETLEKENASHVLTSKTHCPLLQEQPAKTLKMGLYPVGEQSGGEMMDRRSAACANPRPDWRLSSFKRIVIKHVVDCPSCCNKHCYTPNSAL